MNKIIKRILLAIVIAPFALLMIRAWGLFFYHLAQDILPITALLLVVGFFVFLVRILPRNRNGTSLLWCILGALAVGQASADRQSSEDEDDFIRSKWNK